MVFLASIFFTLFLLFFAIKEFYQIKLRHKPTMPPKDVFDILVNHCRTVATKNQVLYVVGSGWGSFVYKLALALQHVLIIGIEPNPSFWLWSQIRSTWNVVSNVRLYYRHFAQWQGIQSAPSIIFVNLSPDNTKRLNKKLKKGLQTNRELFIYNAEIDGLTPFKTYPINQQNTLYHYTKDSLK